MTMTEQEWLACNDPRRMMDFVRGKSSDRKLRLFVCGYLRTFLPRHNDELSQEALEMSERFADGLAAAEDLEACRSKARATARTGNKAAQLAVDAAFLNLPRAIEQVFGDLTTHADKRNKVQLLHDLWGPVLFRRLPIEPSWLTPRVVELARSIYADRSFDRLPALADALEEAGCHDADILGHCRGPGLHVRGCWVLDLILGKA
ncbi:MAG: hypothetical protein KatS3mg105_4685 [Gemmatales bacterium]|nr:MAG: hypothetical protein KatS3mg105_4685 [Gemmatales bacterium]